MRQQPSSEKFTKMIYRKDCQNQLGNMEKRFLTGDLGRRSKVTSSQAGTPEVTCSHPTLRSKPGLKAQLATHQRVVARDTLVREIEENC